MSLKPIWTYGLQLWGAAKLFNGYKTQTFQSKCLLQVTRAPYFVFNGTRHKGPSIKTVLNTVKIFYECLHRNPLIDELFVHTFLGDPRRRLKRTWCRDLLVK